MFETKKIYEKYKKKQTDVYYINNSYFLEIMLNELTMTLIFKVHTIKV